MKKQWIVLGLILASMNAFSAHHFTDLYETEKGWQVSHFVAQEGKLQDLVETQTFKYQSEALAFEESLKSRYPTQKNFEFSTTEAEAAPLWIVKYNWDLSWEDKFSDWVQSEFTQDFFVKYNLATDCADVSYALRWIFARNNNLPATATLGGSGTVVSHLTAKKEWDKLPGHALWYKDRRFLAALNWLLDLVYTKTLYIDGYPVELSSKTIKAGLTNLIGNHSEVISKVSLKNGDVPIEAMSSTVPQAVRVLNRRIFMDDAVTEKRLGGLLRFRWPTYRNGGWRVTAADEMPYYSLSQYKKDLCPNQRHFTFCLFEILDYNYDPAALVKSLIRDISEYIEARKVIVKDGYEFCKSHNCAPGTAAYEDWSTPSRDKRLAKWLIDTENLSESLGGKATFDEWINSTILTVPFPVALKEFRDRIVYNLTSFDPRDSVESRWARTPLDIEKTLNRFVKEGEIYREELIQNAQGCREKPEECKKGTDNYKKLSSSEIDYDLQTRFAKYMDYFLEQGFVGSKDLIQVFKRLWFRSPAPWDNLSERRGDNSQDVGHLLDATSVQAGAPGWLILDKKRLYSIDQRREIEFERLYTGLYYDSNTETYLAHDRHILQILDSSIQIKAELNLLGLSDDLALVHFFGNGDVFIGECLYETLSCYGTKEGHLLNLRTMEQSEGIIFYQSFVDKNLQGNLFLAGKKYYSMMASSSGIEIKQYPLLEKPLIFVSHLQGHNYFLQLGQFDGNGFDVGYLSGKGFSPIKSNYPTYFVPEKVTSGWLSIRRFYPTSEGAELEGLINLRSYEFTPGLVRLSFSPYDDSRFVVRSGKKVSLFLGESERKFSLGDESFNTILSSAKDWWSLDSGAVFDMQGKFLFRDSQFLRGVCRSSLYLDDCVGTNDNLFFELYRPNDEIEYSYFRFGKNSNFRVQNVNAYKIHKVSPSEGGDLNRVNVGNALVLSRHHLLWFP